MREYIRLQLKLKWGVNRDNNKASAVMTALAALIAVAILLALVGLLTFVLYNNADLSVTVKSLAQLYLSLLMLGLTVAATSMQTTRLYRPGDIAITARFPISPFKLFVSTLILNYIDLCIYSAILVIPVMVVFGAVLKIFTFTYFCGVILGTLFMPMIPFALSVFLAIPIVYLISLLERHNIVRLVLFAIFLVGCFLLYYYLLSELAQFFLHRNWEEGTLEIWAGIIHALDQYYNPAFYLGNVIFFERFWLGAGAILGASVLLTAAGAALARLVFSSLRSKALEGGFGGYTRASTIDNYGCSRAIFRYGAKDILRTKTYSYFYLGVAISTPVMVFFCNKLVSLVGTDVLGSGINFGASMLAIAVYMAMISSFAASVLSIEGKNFYITKLVPVPYRNQLLIKGLLYTGVSVIALIISVTVLAALKFITPAETAVLATAQLLLAVGAVFNGVNLNLANPNLKPKANGEAEEINITYMLIIGLVLAAVLGTLGILLPKVYENGKTWAYLSCIGVALVYAAVNVVIFWFTVNPKYSKIEA